MKLAWMGPAPTYRLLHSLFLPSILPPPHILRLRTRTIKCCHNRGASGVLLGSWGGGFGACSHGPHCVQFLRFCRVAGSLGGFGCASVGREVVEETGRRSITCVRSSRSQRGVVGSTWSKSDELDGADAVEAKRPDGGQGRSGRLSPNLKPTGGVSSKPGVQTKDNEDTNSGDYKEEEPGGDLLRRTIKRNLDKARLKHELSKRAEPVVYTRGGARSMRNRTYSSRSQAKSSEPLQGDAGKEVRIDIKETRMQNVSNSEIIASDGQTEAKERKPKKKYAPEAELRRSLDMCSKYADVMQALDIYDKIVAEGHILFNQYNYNILLYLCSSAATDSLKPQKSGNERRKSNEQERQTGLSQDELDGSINSKAGDEMVTGVSDTMKLREEQRRLCLNRGFEIYNTMKSQGVPPNEATYTAVARLAVAKEDGDLAFDMVKEMAEAKLSPRLRSYAPALYTYCKLKEVKKAFEVDEHMQEAGVSLEESELEALLKLSVDEELEDKVYSLLHRLRATVRDVSLSTVKVIKHWFESNAGASAGRWSWEDLPSLETVRTASESCGGGWHGLGWLGKGPWKVKSNVLDKTGVCQECGEQLITVDLDPQETEMFAESLSALACQREAKNNEFKKFQAWLDRHGPFDVIVDGANVGLYNSNIAHGCFNFYQLNSVVNGIQKKLGSRREPLILLHHRRTRGESAASSFATKTLKRWQEANSIYTTPTGSNDDWYWLYAAVRYKCMLVTNDEMRDHLFQLLGNEFFPKWKERHQVRYTFGKEGPVFHMPPPYSIVIQESEKGSWHVPKSGGDDIFTPREWLCVTRVGYTALENAMSKEFEVSSTSIQRTSASAIRIQTAPSSEPNSSIFIEKVKPSKTSASRKADQKPSSRSSLNSSAKSSTHISPGSGTPEDQLTSPKNVRSRTKKSRSLKLSLTLQNLQLAEKSSSGGPIDFQI